MSARSQLGLPHVGGPNRLTAIRILTQQDGPLAEFLYILLPAVHVGLAARFAPRLFYQKRLGAPFGPSSLAAAQEVIFQKDVYSFPIPRSHFKMCETSPPPTFITEIPTSSMFQPDPSPDPLPVIKAPKVPIPRSQLMMCETSLPSPFISEIPLSAMFQPDLDPATMETPKIIFSFPIPKSYLMMCEATPPSLFKSEVPESVLFEADPGFPVQFGPEREPVQFGPFQLPVYFGPYQLPVPYIFKALVASSVPISTPTALPTFDAGLKFASISSFTSASTPSPEDLTVYPPGIGRGAANGGLVSAVVCATVMSIIVGKKIGSSIRSLTSPRPPAPVQTSTHTSASGHPENSAAYGGLVIPLVIVGAVVIGLVRILKVSLKIFSHANIKKTDFDCDPVDHASSLDIPVATEVATETTALKKPLRKLKDRAANSTDSPFVFRRKLRRRAPKDEEAKTSNTPSTIQSSATIVEAPQDNAVAFEDFAKGAADAVEPMVTVVPLVTAPAVDAPEPDVIVASALEAPATPIIAAPIVSSPVLKPTAAPFVPTAAKSPKLSAVAAPFVPTPKPARFLCARNTKASSARNTKFTPRGALYLPDACVIAVPPEPKVDENAVGPVAPSVSVPSSA